MECSPDHISSPASRPARGSSCPYPHARLPAKPSWSRRLGSSPLTELAPDPRIGNIETLFQADLRFPVQDLPQQAVVAVPATDALRFAQVVFLLQGLSSDFAHEVDQLVHADELIGAEVEGLCEVRVHQARETFDAIVHVAETASLLAIPPDFDCRSDLRLGNLAADGGGRF